MVRKPGLAEMVSMLHNAVLHGEQNLREALHESFGKVDSSGRDAQAATSRAVTDGLERVYDEVNFFLSAFAALGDPASRAYYDKKITQGKHHTQALLCLARRRADVLFAMLRDGTFYEPQPVRAT